MTFLPGYVKAVPKFHGGAYGAAAGANLPLLVKLAKSRSLPLTEAAAAAVAAGLKYVDSAVNILAARRARA